VRSPAVAALVGSDLVSAMVTEAGGKLVPQRWGPPARPLTKADTDALRGAEAKRERRRGRNIEHALRAKARSG
jgi:hypothetical protein